jgi:DNA-binding transcriptional LysR family regulator
MRFTLRQLQYFRAAAELGSFTAAAKALYVSPTAVAAAVTDLEHALDTHLCIRRKSLGIELTAAGTALLDDARALLASAEELDRAAGSRDGRLRGPVTVGCYATMAATVLPALTSGFAALHPDVTLHHVDGDMDRLLPLLESGRLDVLITYRINLPAGLDEAVLYETAVHVLLPAGHRLAARQRVDLADLADEPLIMLDLPPSGRNTLNLLHAAGVRPDVRLRTPNFELVRSMVARGLGYSLMVQKPPIDHSYEGLPLVVKRIHPELARQLAVMVWPEGTRLNARVSALIEFARETVGRHQWTPDRVV